MGAKLDSTAFESLSARERHVLDMATAGLIDKQICTEFDISINTLKTYWTRIRSKVGRVPRSAIVSGYVSSLLSEDAAPSPLMGYSGMVIDLEKRLVSASDDVNLEHGFLPGERRRLDEYLQMIHPEDRERVSELLQTLVAKQQRTAHCVCRCMASGAPVRVSYMFRPEYGENGEVTKICGFRTVSVDFASSAKLRVGFFEFFTTKERLYVDDDVRAIFGIGPEESLDKSTFLASIVETDKGSVSDTFQAAMTGEGGKQRLDTRLLRSDGQLLPVTVMVSAARMEKGYRIRGTVSALVE